MTLVEVFLSVLVAGVFISVYALYVVWLDRQTEKKRSEAIDEWREKIRETTDSYTEMNRLLESFIERLTNMKINLDVVVAGKGKRMLTEDVPPPEDAGGERPLTWSEMVELPGFTETMQDFNRQFWLDDADRIVRGELRFPPIPM